MTVNTTSLSTGVIRTLSDQSAKLAAALSTSSSSNISASSTSTAAPTLNATTDSVDSSLQSQSQSLSLRVDTLNVSYVGSKINALSSGTTEVSRILGQLQSLATQASAGGLSESAMELLNGQFQALSISINNVPPAPKGSQYTASSLVDGLSSGTVQPTTTSTTPTNGDTLLGGFTSTALLGNSNIATSDAATQALATISTAQSNIAAQQSTLGDLQDQVEFASASVAGAVQNQEASRSTLTEDDLSGNASVSLSASLQANTALAITAQTSRLPSNILQLLA